MNKEQRIKIIIWLIIAVFIAAGIYLLWDSIKNFRGKTSLLSKGEKLIVTSSSLKRLVNVTELSSLRFRYNGIAETKDKKKTVVISYKSSVTASIDMDKIRFKVDKANKKVIVNLPDIRITANVVDQESLSLIPSTSTLSIKKALTACEKDANKEAKKSPELIELADENLKHNIEALIYPLIKSEGYSVEWKRQH